MVEHIARHCFYLNLPKLGHYSIGPRARREEANPKKIPHVYAYVLLFDKRKRILLQKRSSTVKMYPNKLTLSAVGGVRFAESVEKTALRELREELGVKGVKLTPFITKPTVLDQANPFRLYVAFFGEYSGKIKVDKVEVNPNGTKFYSMKEINKCFNQLVPPAQTCLKIFLAKKILN